MGLNKLFEWDVYDLEFRDLIRDMMRYISYYQLLSATSEVGLLRVIPDNINQMGDTTTVALLPQVGFSVGPAEESEARLAK